MANVKVAMAKTKTLTFDLEEYPWPWHNTPQTVFLYEIHVYTKYQMSISIWSKVMANVKMGDLTYIFYFWPWRMTLTLTYDPQTVLLNIIHMHAKYLVSMCNGSKVMANVKVVLKQTNIQGKNNMPPRSWNWSSKSSFLVEVNEITIFSLD